MATNPYAAPRAEVSDVHTEETQPVRLWSASGRVGRLRYLAYATGATLIAGCFVGLLTALLGTAAAAVITIIAYVVLTVFSVLLMIQRSHDMDWSGWTILLAIIPLVALIWLLKAGTQGPNTYGPPPPPNTTAVKILGLLLPIICLIGLVAAIALPAYQQYVMRANGG